MDSKDEDQDDDGPPGRSSSGSPIVEPEHRIRDALISCSPGLAAVLTRFIGEQNLDT
jgi:hypothetical protein